MKRQKKMIILLGVLAVCVAGTVAVSRIDFEEKMSETETAIIDIDSSDITRLAWDYEEEVAFVRQDGTWKYEADDKMAVDQDLLEEIAENLSQITSDKMVEEVQALSVYGLSDPSYSITVETEDKTYEIQIGDETFSDGEIYISIGDDYVYLTDAELTDEISYSLLDCVQKEEIPEMESISSLSIENGETLDMVYKEDSGYCYSDAYTYYLKEGEEYRNLDNEKGESTFSSLSEFSWEECADYYAEDSELSNYGLEEPAAEVSIVYTPVQEEDEEETSETGEEQEFSYQVGTANDTYYARLTDSNIIYTISQEVYDAAVNASYEELKPDEVILLDWSTVDSIDIEFDGNVYSVDVENGGEEDAVYTFNDSEITFEDILEELSEITLSEDQEAELRDNKEELALTFHRNTEENTTVELVFYQYNGSYCISVLNGQETNCVDREAVVDLKEAINSVILDTNYEE